MSQNRNKNEKILKIFGTFLIVVLFSCLAFAIIAALGNHSAPGADIFIMSLVISLQVSFLIALAINQ
jgi:hypothetical protein